ncbi:MAG TPA: S41 family peptidase [Vicinamibacterales bacterium]|nr:S41 family peptidase [Vicinamibacterales bacterium]
MRKTTPGVIVILLGTSVLVGAQGLSANDAVRLHTMLRDASDAVKKNYYDPTYHSLNWDARFKEYDEKLKSAPSLNAGLTMIAAFLDGLKDSHTYFAPPTRPYRLDYGYRLAPIGDEILVTRVRPGTDAETKVKPGDRLMALDGRPVTRENFGTMEYVLNTLSPRQTTKLALRDPSAGDREVVVETKVVPGRQVRNLTGAGADMELNDLIKQQELDDRQYRQKFAEIGDVMIWKMPVFLLDNGEIDKLFGIARRHSTLILDLRENPGGLVEAAKRMVANLFDHDVKVFDRLTRRGRSAVVVKSRGVSAYAGKLIVLVDSGSASSAEILARVVQLEKRGTVMGDRSAGAVMETQFLSFAQGGETAIFYSVAVTDADLVMTDGNSLEGVGVKPDELSLPTPLDLAAGRDPVLAQAARLAGLSLDPVAAGKLFPFEWRPF